MTFPTAIKCVLSAYCLRNVTKLYTWYLRSFLTLCNVHKIQDIHELKDDALVLFQEDVAPIASRRDSYAASVRTTRSVMGHRAAASRDPFATREND